MTTGDIRVPDTLPTVIGVRGARHNNLQDVNVDVPLWRTVAVVGVSGSGKTSLAIGTLYAEGMHRFLEGLSTYSRRRLTQAQRPDVDRIDHLPAALALRQRPPIPGPRSTVGTMSEVLNVLRLMMSRLGSHLCPNGHLVEPSIATQSEEIVCPVCGARFEHPSAESFSFNSYGACPACQGLGVRRRGRRRQPGPGPGQDDRRRGGSAVERRRAPPLPYAARELGVRLDVPWRALTDHERDIVLHGEPVEQQVRFRSGRRGHNVELNVTYQNAIATAQRALQSESDQARRRSSASSSSALARYAMAPGSARGADLLARRPEPRRDQRAPAGRTAPFHGQPAPDAASRARADDPPVCSPSWAGRSRHCLTSGSDT